MSDPLIQESMGLSIVLRTQAEDPEGPAANPGDLRRAADLLCALCGALLAARERGSPSPPILLPYAPGIPPTVQGRLFADPESGRGPY